MSESRGYLDNTSGHVKLADYSEGSNMGGPNVAVRAKAVQGAYLVPTTSPVSYDAIVLGNSGRDYPSLDEAYGTKCNAQYAEYACPK